MSEILGIHFSDKTQKMTTDYLTNIMDIPVKSVTHVVTANPEMVMRMLKSPGFKKIVKAADLVTADGMGIVWASKLLGENIPERVTGYDTIISIFEKREREKKRIKVYCLGADDDTIKKATRIIEEKYKFVQIVGYRNGYFKRNDEFKIIQEINSCSPDLLLVGIGSPKQEHFIFNQKEFLKAKVAIGVGGAFDVLSGNVQRAPMVFQKTGMEWFYRLLTNPKRFKRQLSLFSFGFKVLFVSLGIQKDPSSKNNKS